MIWTCPLVARGKVREIYDAGADRLLLVASDRISAYDHVLPTPIPDKGRVLTAAVGVVVRPAGAGARVVRGVAPPDLRRPTCPPRRRGRAMLVRRLEMLPVECVARGYLSGSGTVEYSRDRRDPGRRAAGRPGRGLAAAGAGVHAVDEGGGRASTTRRSTSPSSWRRSGAARAEELRELTLALYSRAAEIALEAGIILADTKFEFGLARRRPWCSATRCSPPTRPASGRPSTWSPGSVAAVVRQAVRARLADVVRLGPRLAAAGAAGRRRRRRPASATSTAYEQLTGPRLRLIAPRSRIEVLQRPMTHETPDLAPGLWTVPASMRRERRRLPPVPQPIPSTRGG